MPIRIQQIIDWRWRELTGSCVSRSVLPWKMAPSGRTGARTGEGHRCLRKSRWSAACKPMVSRLQTCGRYCGSEFWNCFI